MNAIHNESPKTTFRRFNSEQARSIRTEIEDVYRHSYVDAINSGDPFDSIDAFMRRFEAYTKSRGFDLVVAYQDGKAAGQTWGWPLHDVQSGTGWWSGLVTEPEPAFTVENGRRTFALSEIMVCQEAAGTGLAHALHDELLAARTEERATLLVEPENSQARRAYLNWGWRQVSQLRPRWENAPLFDVFMLSLPIGAKGPTN